MKKYLVSYATGDHRGNQKQLELSAYKFGIDEVISLSEDFLHKDSFYEDNKEILDHKRGAGYWLWKPYVIIETLKTIQENDILVYSDSRVEIVSSLEPLIEACNKNNIIVFNVGTYLNKTWTRRDCFVLMNCDSDESWNGRHCTASLILLKNNETSRQFINEWLSYCQNKNILTDLPNICGQPNFPEFKDHRHDQSVLSLLAHKYDLKTLPNPYPEFIERHHKKHFHFELIHKILQKIKKSYLHYNQLLNNRIRNLCSIISYNLCSDLFGNADIC